MTLNELIDAAAEVTGGKGPLAKEMCKAPARVSEWVSGKYKPDASEIAFMAKLAGLPVLQTVADIEQQLNSRYAEVWRSALGKLTAAGIAASMVMGVTLIPDRANATQTAGTVRPEPTAPVAPSPSQVRHAQSVYYVNLIRRFLNRLFGRSRAAVQFR